MSAKVSKVNGCPHCARWKHKLAHIRMSYCRNTSDCQFKTPLREWRVREQEKHTLTKQKSRADKNNKEKENHTYHEHVFYVVHYTSTVYQLKNTHKNLTGTADIQSKWILHIVLNA